MKVFLDADALAWRRGRAASVRVITVSSAMPVCAPPAGRIHPVIFCFARSGALVARAPFRYAGATEWHPTTPR